MEFGFTEEQMMFRETIYKYAKNEIYPLCEEADLKAEFSHEVWGKLGAMGLLGLPFPEEYNGSGADVVTCCLAAEALGHAGVEWAGAAVEKVHRVAFTGWTWVAGEWWVACIALARALMAGLFPAWRAYRQAAPELLGRG